MPHVRAINISRDFPQVAAIISAIDPRPITAEAVTALCSTKTPGEVSQRVVAVDDQVQGYASTIYVPRMPDGHFRAWIAVHPARQGCRSISTNNDSENQPILRINERLGHHPQPGMYIISRTLTQRPSAPETQARL